jgi:hypothetical protein
MDLAASIVTAAATVGLAVLAYVQIHAGQNQAKEAKQQSNAALAMAETQSAASLRIARETREAAERQWQPRVIAHKWSDPKPGTGDDAAPDEMAVGYSLKNEGTGPAFNVEHGVEVGGRLHKWGAGLYHAMMAGEEVPPMRNATGQPVKLTPLIVGVKQEQWVDDIVYWTRYENLLGERFEVRCPPDETKPAEFRRLT